MANNGWGTVAALLVVGVVLYQCHQQSNQETEATVEDQIADRAADIRAGSYQDAHGDEGCSSDCSGHEAGFESAKTNNITSESDCSSHGDDTGSFAEGCKAYVNAEDTAATEVSEDK